MFHGLFFFVSHCFSCLLYIWLVYSLWILQNGTLFLSKGCLQKAFLQGFVNLSAVYVSQVLHRAAGLRKNGQWDVQRLTYTTYTTHLGVF